MNLGCNGPRQGRLQDLGSRPGGLGRRKKLCFGSWGLGI